MRIFGFEIPRKKTAVPAMRVSTWMGGVLESFGGAWQRNIVAESTANLLAFSAVYACVALIAGDVAKLRPKLMRRDRAAKIWEEDENGFPLLERPNRFQTRQQFMEYWVASKLIYGNAYILKERDGRGRITALYPLDPRSVVPLVAPDSDVFYQLGGDQLAGLPNGAASLHAAEIIHDRMTTLWHPLCGVSPIYACGASATQGIRIQNNSEAFFRNMSRPSGMLTAPSAIDDLTAARLKREFANNFGGSNLGALFVGGDALKYEAMTMPAHDAQLIEQLRWTVEDIARVFKVPLHMLQMSGASPTYSNAENYTLSYYSQTLQTQIEAIESLLDRGLDLPAGARIEFDLEGLLRMDSVTRADAAQKLVTAGVMAPNEARRNFNLPPVTGGDTPFLQQQMWSLEQLSQRQPPQDAPVLRSWDRDAQYESGAVVLHDGRKWRSKIRLKGLLPGDGEMWEPAEW